MAVSVATRFGPDGSGYELWGRDMFGTRPSRP
jgi:hypothetical protein